MHVTLEMTTQICYKSLCDLWLNGGANFPSGVWKRKWPTNSYILYKISYNRNKVKSIIHLLSINSFVSRKFQIRNETDSMDHQYQISIIDGKLHILLLHLLFHWKKGWRQYTFAKDMPSCTLEIVLKIIIL